MSLSKEAIGKISPREVPPRQNDAGNGIGAIVLLQVDRSVRLAEKRRRERSAPKKKTQLAISQFPTQNRFDELRYALQWMSGLERVGEGSVVSHVLKFRVPSTFRVLAFTTIGET